MSFCHNYDFRIWDLKAYKCKSDKIQSLTGFLLCFLGQYNLDLSVQTGYLEKCQHNLANCVVVISCKALS